MKQVIQHVRSRRLEVADVPAPGCKPGGILVRTATSLISAGTERMVTEFAGKSLLGKARERPDLVRQVLEKVRREGVQASLQAVLARLNQPIPLGYSSCGVVVEVGRGAEEFTPGQRVACAGMGYASHADVVFVPKNLAVAVPNEVAFDDAAYVTVGAIALQGLRVADVRLGDNVAVIGLGLLGQLSVQLLVAAGCRVIGVDLDPRKVQLARELGAHAAVARGDDVVGESARFTHGVGLDAVLITAAADTNDPTELAGEIARDRARVVVVGAVRMDVPRKVYYEKELELRLSRSYGPGRYDRSYEEQGHDYPIGYVRWTERRNMEEFLRLVARGAVTPERLTTHRFAIADALAAYDLISGRTGEAFGGVLLTYPTDAAAQADSAARVVARPTGARAPRRAGAPRIGFVGAGAFARSVLLPRFRAAGAELVGVATSSGVTSHAVAEQFGFRYATTETERLLADPDVEGVVIATRHGSHAALAARALRAGKAVFLEKPLAIDEAGLAEVIAAQAETGGVLVVGFNRRFSRLAVALREALPDAPLGIVYRVNAGAVPPDHWTLDPHEGGGRLIGEGCHFVDLCQYLIGADPVTAYATPLGDSPDSASITLEFADGSHAVVSYLTGGDRGIAKERVEVFGGGVGAVLDDFRSLTVSTGGRARPAYRGAQDKGFEAEIAAFLAAARGTAPAPIPLASLVATTRATFAAVRSLASAVPVRVG